MLCFGRAEPYKNLETAIKLARVLEPLGVESILIVAPYSKNQPILKMYRRLQKLHCPNLKLILDADFDLPHKIMNSSLSLVIVFIPSKREPFGLIVEEARKCNRKILVVANNTGGLRNQISDLHDGVLVDVNKIEEIKQKIYKVINDKTITNKIVYEGRKTLKERYDLTKNLKIGLEKIINGV